MLIVENKHGLGKETMFDFKYVPEFSKRTLRENPEGGSVQQAGVEKRNLLSFVIGFISVGIVCFLALRGLKFIIEKAAIVD